MDYTEMTVDELMEKRTALVADLDKDGADLDQIEKEVRSINAEMEQRKAVEAKKAETRAAVAEGEGNVIKTIVEERETKKMDNLEVRKSKEYVEAFANYIKTENDAECRALLSENATNGTIPVPEFVENVVRTAWEREGIMSRVRKSYVKGNLKVGFEISGTDATVHTEGGAGVSEETLVMGTVAVIPSNIKKWISLSDEIYAMRSEEFLNYVYDELTYRIAKKAADELIRKIDACGTTSTTTCVAVSKITATQASLGLVAQAVAALSDDAPNPIIVMNKSTWASFKAVQYSANYAADPFEGLEVVFNNSIKALSAASTGDTWMIVGDFETGAIANFPEGEGISFKFDDLTLATSDLIKIIGREYVGIEPVAPFAFAKVGK